MSLPLSGCPLHASPAGRSSSRFADPLAGLAVDALDGQLGSELEKTDPLEKLFEAPTYQPADTDTARPASSPGLPPPVDLGALSHLLDASGSEESLDGAEASDGVAVQSLQAPSREILFVDAGYNIMAI